MSSPAVRIPLPPSSVGRSQSAVPPSSAFSPPASASSPVALHFPANSRISRYSYDTDSAGQHVHLTDTTHTGSLARNRSPPLPTHHSSSSSYFNPSPSTSSSSSSSSSMAPSSSSSTLSSLRQRNANAAELPTGPSGRAQLAQFTSDLKAQRRRVRLLTSPITTLTLFAEIVWEYVHTTAVYLLSHRALLYSLLSTVVFLLVLYTAPGPHQRHLSSLSHVLSFSLLWLTLGILSSVGLGTGLHTFVLYLGPYIAKATLAVTECNSMEVALSGPEAFLCPTKNLSLHSFAPVTFVGLLLKVAPAALLWGAGTAMGELPPYFVSRAATLSGQKLAELDALTEIDEHSNPPSPAGPTPYPSPSLSSSSSSSSRHHHHHVPHLSLVDRAKLLIYHALQRYGFWAIVLFASIPNPLFDLAGLACGHFLIPFWTFFGATVIGKAVIKAQLQTALVIVAFNRERLEGVILALEHHIAALRGKLGPFFERQRAQFHTEGGGAASASGDGGVNWFSMAWNVFLACMILWFVVSIIDSSVQEKLATRDQAKIEKFAQDKGVVFKSDASKEDK